MSYYYQTWIAGGTITRIKQTSINIIKNVKSNKGIKTIQELILDNIESYNTFNQYFYNLWESSSVYPSKWLHPVLALANYFMTDEEKPHFIAMDAETQVEHILPQNPKKGSQWNADFNEGKKEKWVNNIANLTLLKRKKNAKALNGDFDEKRKIYSGKDPSKAISCYDITKELYRDYKKWDENSLQKRRNFLRGIITPILHIEGQEEFEEEIEEEIDLE